MDHHLKKINQFKPAKMFFIGIDSDGCVFDTMGIKQRECFCPWMIAYFGLQPVALAARQCKEFADLFSKTRGANRHKTVALILSKLLPQHPLVIEAKFNVPRFEYYVNWVANPDSQLSDNGLREAISRSTDSREKAELTTALEWSLKVNETVEQIVKNIPPFVYVRNSLEKMSKVADVVVISATPFDTILREWDQNGILQYATYVAGQEMGAKKEQLSKTAMAGYEPNCSLMIGDAPGDLLAAKQTGCLFYPIIPGGEMNSWRRLFEDAFDRFINFTYHSQYESDLIAKFDVSLPEKPSWL